MFESSSAIGGLILALNPDWRGEEAIENLAGRRAKPSERHEPSDRRVERLLS
jgi:hypothetical protein